MKKYAVLGFPIAHSKSPLIHHGFAKETNIILTYKAIEVTPSAFEDTVHKLVAEGYSGFNITLPLKGLAYAIAKHHSEEAILAQAVNTIAVTKTGLYGHNTDGIGLLNDIQNYMGKKLSEQTVLILGAGGATKGILPPIIKASPKNITLANRTVNKAELLVQHIHNTMNNTPPLLATGLKHIPQQPFDVIINATASSLGQQNIQLSSYCINKKTLAVDLMYSDGATAFCQWARQYTDHCYDGFGMLIQQAAFAFETWTGLLPNIQYNYEKWQVKR